MTNRMCSAVERALKLVDEGKTIAEASAAEGVSRSAVTRARRRLGLEPLPPGFAIDGRAPRKVRETGPVEPMFYWPDGTPLTSSPAPRSKPARRPQGR